MERVRSVDSGFITRATEVVLKHVDEAGFSSTDLAVRLHLSREQIHRKLKQDLSLPSSMFIRYIRLLKAFVYLTEGEDSVAEVCYKVGFDSPSYFNKCFKKAWGLPPGEIKKGNFAFPLTSKPIYSFYRKPEIHAVLQRRGIFLDLSTFKENDNKKRKAWLIAAIPLLSLVVVSSILWSKNDSKDIFTLGYNSRIAVLPFTNRTGDSRLDPIGDIASSWISSQIAELKDVQTVPYFTIKQYESYIGILPDDPQQRPTFRELVGAQYFISGNYFLKDRQIYFDAHLVDAYSQEYVYHLPAMSGSEGQVMEIIEELRLKIAGLITNLEKVKLGKLTPPNYLAYHYYLNGLKELSSGLLSPSDALLYFEKATELEPDFVMPQVFKTWFFYGEKRDSIYQQIGKIPGITDYERRVYLESYHLFNRNYQEALRISLQCLNDYPLDYYFNMTAGHRAKSLFMPNLAIKVLSQLKDPLNSDVGLVWHHFKVRNYFEALDMLGKYQEAHDYLESVPIAYYSPVILEFFINNDVKLDKSKEEVAALIENFKMVGAHLHPVYYTAAAYEFGLASEEEASQYFARKALEGFFAHPGDSQQLFDVVDALYLAGDLPQAKAILKEQLKENPASDDHLVYLALVEAALGHAAVAERILSQMEGRLILLRRNNLEYEVDYLKARMHALLGQKDEAILGLKSALEKGQLRHYYDFERDIFLKPLFDYPPFLELTRPRD